MAKQPSRGGKTPRKQRKKPAPQKAPRESIKVETVIDAIPPEVHAIEPATPALDKPKIEADLPAERRSVPVVEKAAPVVENTETSKTDTADVAPLVPAPSPPPAKKGVFFPLLLGGLIAGAIGFFVATQMIPKDTALIDQVAAQSASISALEDQVAALPRIDLSGVEAAQAELSTNIASVQTKLDDGLAALDGRIADLEKLPTGAGTISDRVIAAYEADLEALRAEMQALGGTAIAQLEEARDEAASIEENAAAAARAAAGRAALARIQISLDTGEPLRAALTDLEAAIEGPVPDELLAAQDGVPTLLSLQEGFSDVASAALSAARNAGVAGEKASGFGAFLKNQLEVRSTTPQEGTTTDAILSRAEAAVDAGRLPDALAEIATLPEEARVEMIEWLGLAETRAGAVSAVDALSTSLNDS